MERAFGAWKHLFHANLSAKGAMHTSLGRSPRDEKAKEKGLKARSIG